MATFVYRAGDQIVAWSYPLLMWLGLGLAGISFVAASLAADGVRSVSGSVGGRSVWQSSEKPTFHSYSCCDRLRQRPEARDRKAEDGD